jgi:hypothetical protein
MGSCFQSARRRFGSAAIAHGTVNSRMKSAGFSVLLLTMASCGRPGGDSAPESLNALPFAHLQSCADAPYVGFFSGVTEEGLEHQQSGSSPSSDIYGIGLNGEAKRITTDLGSYSFAPSADASTIFASPRRRLLGASADEEVDQIVAIDARTAEQTVLLESPGLSDMAASPDGRYLAVLAAEVDGVHSTFARVAFFDIEARDLAYPPGFDALAEQADRFLAWGPDGARLAYITQIEGSNEIRVMVPASGEERVLYQTEAELGSLDWSADGRRILASEILVPDAESLEASLLEIDVETRAAETAVLTDAPAVPVDPVYSSVDGSALTAITVEGKAVTAQTWSREEAGVFVATASAPLRGDGALIAAGGLRIPSCAAGSQ